MTDCTGNPVGQRSVASVRRCAQAGDNTVDRAGYPGARLGVLEGSVPVSHRSRELCTRPAHSGVDPDEAVDLRLDRLSTVSTGPTTTTYCSSSKEQKPVRTARAVPRRPAIPKGRMP